MRLTTPRLSVSEIWVPPHSNCRFNTRARRVKSTTFGLAEIAFRENQHKVRAINVDEFLFLLDVLREELGNSLDDLIAARAQELLIVFAQSVRSDHETTQGPTIGIGLLIACGRRAVEKKTLLGNFVRESVPAIRIQRRLLARSFSFSSFNRAISACRSAGSWA